MSALRGRGRGGTPARGGGRGGGAQGTPLVSQMRQVLRLEEPKEMVALRRYKDLGASQIRSRYGVGGLLKMEVKIAAEFRGDYDEDDGFVDIADADDALALLEERRRIQRALDRREVRLPEARRRASWASLTPEEKRVLTLSQKEWNSFRASRGGGAVGRSADGAVG